MALPWGMQIEFPRKPRMTWRQRPVPGYYFPDGQRLCGAGETPAPATVTYQGRVVGNTTCVCSSIDEPCKQRAAAAYERLQARGAAPAPAPAPAAPPARRVTLAPHLLSMMAKHRWSIRPTGLRAPAAPRPAAPPAPPASPPVAQPEPAAEPAEQLSQEDLDALAAFLTAVVEAMQAGAELDADTYATAEQALRLLGFDPDSSGSPGAA